MRRWLLTTFLMLSLSSCIGMAWGQQTSSLLNVDNFHNANTTGAPDATFRITNPEVSNGNVCASIFVFDAVQELMECCGCLLPPRSLRKLSVNKDLTSSPLTGLTLTAGIVEVVSTAPVSGLCPTPTGMKPVPDLRVWVTHIQDARYSDGGTFAGRVAQF